MVGNRKMEDYQGSEETEVHYEKKHLPLLVGSVCLCICVLLRNMPASLLAWSFDVDVDCWPH